MWIFAANEIGTTGLHHPSVMMMMMMILYFVQCTLMKEEIRGHLRMLKKITDSRKAGFDGG